ncbi:S8 family peptidase [Herbihabitans rhizosphaerae]|uniref:S8 family peptidase n=1 Tax=Herbihabitans rhizosphaerae TaxID=1872711 RepID=UPI001A90DCBE|nr:S8 family peptidase [Herbihabitans rhizosphaerae]
MPAHRREHGQQLHDALRQVDADAEVRRRQRDVQVEGAVDGVYVSFESFPGVHLALKKLDPQQGTLHPELRSVQEVDLGDGVTVERATVFVPQGKLTHFLDRITQYVETADAAKPRNRDLVDRVQAVRTASIAAMWTDPPAEFPEPGQLFWWEAWLRRRDGNEVSRFRAFASATDLRTGSRSLGFGDRTVMLVEATVDQLASAVDVLDDLAELRRPHDPTQFLAETDATEQTAWIGDLVDRLEPADLEAPAVCVIDSGVHQEHPLLKASLPLEDCHAADLSWPVYDDRGHGTEMAGLALYGDLGQALSSPQPLRLRHRLESIKLLPPPPQQNAPDLYGAVTAAGTSRAEIQAPDRRRVYSLAVTAPMATSTNGAAAPAASGQPSSWSASLDALAAGRSVLADDDGLVFLDDADHDAKRLFVVSAGNVRSWHPGEEHLDRSDLEPVEDPAQAWNVLTVGAYTELDTMNGAAADFAGWTPWAPRGELSPFSRTSVAFSRVWPVKPDVVLEGGNVARSPDGTMFDTPPNLQLLTTNAPLGTTRLLTTTHATSAATAQAAALSASVIAEYPALWPETVRALIVHSAEWTPAMKGRFPAGKKKAPRIALHRRYGMGVPDLARATRSATDALTLIAQDTIHPFASGAMREIHYHDLPWPTEVLAGLGEAQVRLRVTLSYFIEPNPGRRGWRRRYSYASHGLRFDLRRAIESNAEFQKRINEKALSEDEQRASSSNDTGEWFFGPDHQRAPGSLHTDIWIGNAADLAQRGALAVFPVSGWWKENKARDRSADGARYALILSIETPALDVDVWTPVAQQINVPVSITTAT